MVKKGSVPVALKQKCLQRKWLVEKEGCLLKQILHHWEMGSIKNSKN